MRGRPELSDFLLLVLLVLAGQYVVKTPRHRSCAACVQILVQSFTAVTLDKLLYLSLLFFKRRMTSHFIGLIWALDELMICIRHLEDYLSHGSALLNVSFNFYWTRGTAREFWVEGIIQTKVECKRKKSSSPFGTGFSMSEPLKCFEQENYVIQSDVLWRCICFQGWWTGLGRGPEMQRIDCYHQRHEIGTTGIRNHINRCHKILRAHLSFLKVICFPISPLSLPPLSLLR